VENSCFGYLEPVRTWLTETEMADLGRIAGMLEGKRFVEAFQPSAKHNEWCLRFDVAEIGISIRPGEYDPSERIIEEVRRQLALVSGTIGVLRSSVPEVQDHFLP